MTDSIPDVGELLPHRPPMRLLDRVIGWSGAELQAQVSVGPTAAFFRAGRGVPAWIGVEYLGQAAAAWFTLMARSDCSTPSVAPQPGMLVACRRFHSEVGYFAPSALLTVTVRPASATSGALVKFEGDIRVRTELARGELSVYMGREGAMGREGPAAGGSSV